LKPVEAGNLVKGYTASATYRGIEVSELLNAAKDCRGEGQFEGDARACRVDSGCGVAWREIAHTHCVSVRWRRRSNQDLRAPALPVGRCHALTAT